VKKRRRAVESASTAFARGFLVTGMLVALQGRGASGRKTLRHAVQGGSALAAGTIAAEALSRRDYGLAVAAVAAGAAGVLAAEHLLNSDSEGDTHVQEEG
jgi:hypothetical protein